MSVQAVAMLPIPQAGQDALAQSQNRQVRRALAASPHLLPTTANRLAGDKDTTTAVRALRKADDPALLVKAFKRGGHRLLGACWNPNAPAELLAAQLEHGSIQAKQIAVCNSAAPLEARTRALEAPDAPLLTQRVEPLGMAVVKACVLVMENPWLEDRPELWTPMLCRAIGSMPWISEATAERIKAQGWHRWRSFVLNPALASTPIKDIATSDLAAALSSAAHLAALSRPDFSSADARAILAHGEDLVEPHVLGLVLRTCGIAVFEGMPPVAITRVRSSAWFEPAANYLRLLREGDHADWIEATDSLGNDPQAWATFDVLEESWHGNASSLAGAASAL